MSDAVDIMPSQSGFKARVNAGFKALLLSLACLSACLGTNAQAGNARAGAGGLTPVSEELHGNARAQGETALRSNSIRSDVNRYNAERSTRAPANQGEPRQLQELRNGYRTN
jgi:hypothetical protein